MNQFISSSPIGFILDDNDSNIDNLGIRQVSLANLVLEWVELERLNSEPQKVQDEHKILIGYLCTPYQLGLQEKLLEIKINFRDPRTFRVCEFIAALISEYHSIDN